MTENDSTFDPRITFNKSYETLDNLTLDSNSMGSGYHSTIEDVAAGILPEVDLRVTDGYYRMLCPFAEGGFGEVWLAEQKALKRIVAIKTVNPAKRNKASGSTEVEKFLHRSFLLEAITTAQLDHPNIVPVHDLGVARDGWPQLAMKLVKGDTWRNVLKNDFLSLPEDDYLAKHLQVFITVMQAVAFAHSKGIVHRDIKPEQVMLGEFGEIHLMDWGLALTVIDEEELEKDAEVYFGGMNNKRTAPSPGGTPGFMAPEQTLPTAASISFQTDVYLLGGVLYTILTGKTPRSAPTFEECMVLAAEGKYKPLSESVGGRHIPSELAAIVEDALQPDPARRPTKVKVLIDRVQNYLFGKSNRDEAEQLVKGVEKRFEELIVRISEAKENEVGDIYTGLSECYYDLGKAKELAPRVQKIEPLRQLILRENVHLALGYGDLQLARGTVPLLEESEERRKIESDIKIAEDKVRHRESQRRLLAASLVTVLVLLVIGTGMYIRAEQRSSINLRAERDAAREATLARELARQEAERATADSIQLREDAEWEQYFANIEAASYRAQNRFRDRAITSLLERTPPQLRAWEWGHLAWLLHRDRMTIKLYDGINHSIFSPDGSEIQTTSRDGRITVWDAGTGRYLRTLKPIEGRVLRHASSPDGSRLVLNTNNPNMYVIDSKTGIIINQQVAHERSLTHVAWAPCGRYIATASRDETINIWDANNYQILRRLRGLEGGASAISFLPGGDRLISGTRQGVARIHDTGNGNELIRFPDQDGAILSISHDSETERILLVSVSGVRIYDESSADLLMEIEVGDSQPAAGTFVAHGHMVALMDSRGALSIHDSDSGWILAETLVSSPVNSIKPSPDQQYILVGCRSNGFVFDVDALVSAPEIRPAIIETGMPEDFDFSLRVYGLTPGRDPSWNHRERDWNIPEGRSIVEIDEARVAIDSRYAALSPDGRWRFEMDPATLFGEVRDLESGDIVYTHPRVILVMGDFSPDGRHLFIAEPFNGIHLIGTNDWSVRHTLVNPQDEIEEAMLARYIPSCAAFTPDSRRLIVPYLNGRVVSWDVSTGMIVHESPAVRGVGATIAFSADGSRFLIGGNDHRATMWETETGFLLSDFVGHDAWITSATFSWDGSRILTTSRDQTVRLWDTESGRDIMALYHAPADLTIVGAHFLKGDRSLIVVLNDGSVRILDTHPWEPERYTSTGGALKFVDEFELKKRRRAIGPHITPEDVTRTPQFSNL